MEDWGREWTKGKEEERENSVGLSEKKNETKRTCHYLVLKVKREGGRGGRGQSRKREAGKRSLTTTLLSG